MATHRRPPAVLVPVELLHFDFADWAEPGDGDRWPAFWRWCAARKAWVAAHAENHGLGSVLWRMKTEGAVRRSREFLEAS